MTTHLGVPLFKHILIVGANRGIGLGLVKEALIVYPEAIVYATARDTMGANDLQELAKTHGKRLDILQVDMLDEDSTAKAAKYLGTVTSTLDLAIFNAGIALGAASLAELTSKDLLDNLHANVVGPHNLFKAFAPFVEASKCERKTIGIITSLLGSITALPEMVPYIKKMFSLDHSPVGGYSVTKTGVNMLGRQWGEYLQPHGIVVALIHPGAVNTDMNRNSNTIPVEESATGILKAINRVTLASSKDGIIAYDGVVHPW